MRQGKKVKNGKCLGKWEKMEEEGWKLGKLEKKLKKEGGKWELLGENTNTKDTQ